MMKIRRNPAGQRGVTLIEALIAMAVMAFGMLALVGVQTTLRVNADLAKQRAEATRLAELEIETARSFLTVGAGGAADTEFDNLGDIPAHTVVLPESNTKYESSRTILLQPDGLQRTVMVKVEWKDRFDNIRSVVVRDVLSRTSPKLSGLVSTVKKTTAVGQRQGRHPTIPVRAGDLGNKHSGFKPQEGGSIAWVFDNVTGAITSVCTVDPNVASSDLDDPGDLTDCDATNAQLLAGFVRFNLRGATEVMSGSASIFKPVPAGEIAWIVDHSASQIVQRCTVSAGSTTSSLALSPPATCSAVTPAQGIAPFNPATSATALDHTDSENPQWPALNLKVDLVHATGETHTSAPSCFANAPATTVAANGQTIVEYFCIVYPKADGTVSWMGTSTLAPLGFSDANGAPWTIGSVANTYRVCRFTTAASAFTANQDHPAAYGVWAANCGDFGQPACRPVTGNLINQNFLVIEGSKTCPTDVAVNPAAGDLVNTNTLQHQP